MPKIQGDAPIIIEISTITVEDPDEIPCLLQMAVEKEGRKLNFLCDTGASANLIKLSYVPDDQKKQIVNREVIITGITPDQVAIIGSCMLNYYIGGYKITYEAFVCKDESISLRADGILSKQFMKFAKMWLRDENDTIKFRGIKYPLKSYADIIENKEIKNSAKKNRSTEIRVKTSGLLKLQGQSGMCCSVQLTRPATGPYLFVPDNSRCKQWGIEYTPSMHHLNKDRRITIYVLNAAPVRTKIYKNSRIGTLVPLNEQTLGALMECNHLECAKPTSVKEIQSYDLKTGPFHDDDEEEEEELTEKLTKIQDVRELIKTEHMDEEQKAKLFELVKEYEDIFWRPGMKLTTTHLAEAEIDTGDNQPVSVKPYRTPQKLQQPLKDEIKDLLEQEIIEPIDHSPWNSPAILLTKQVLGKTKRRLVIDFRAVNAITAPITCSFPELFQTIHKAGNSTLFSSLDKIRAFHQIPLRHSDKPKTAFTTEVGKFQFRTMPFGLKNAAIIYQQLMNTLFMAKADGFCQAFLDDILAYSGEGTDDHVQKLRKIFEILREANLKLRADKCNFFQKQVRYLGFQISKDGIVPDDEKLLVVKNFPTPENPRHVKQFIGLVTFFARHCPHFSQTAAPLTELTKPTVPFEWTPQCEKAFKTLKEQLCRKIRLAFPDPDLPYSMYTDASDLAVGAILVQEQDGEMKPISLASRKLNKAERKYPTYRKEFQAIKFGLKTFKHFLIGQRFTVFTDHRPLIWLTNSKRLKPVFERDAALLAEYSMEIVYIKGKDNTAADACSRVLLDKGNVEYLPDNPQTNYETYEEFLSRWESKFPKVEVKSTPTKSAARKASKPKKHSPRPVKQPKKKAKPKSSEKGEINSIDINKKQETVNIKDNVVHNIELLNVDKWKTEKTHSIVELQKIHESLVTLDIMATHFAEAKDEFKQLSITDARDKNYLQFQELLVQLLLKVDEVESYGNADVRARRKTLVNDIQAVLDNLTLPASPCLQDGQSQESEDRATTSNSGDNNARENLTFDIDDMEMDQKFLEDLSSTENSSSSDSEFDTADSELNLETGLDTTSADTNSEKEEAEYYVVDMEESKNLAVMEPKIIKEAQDADMEIQRILALIKKGNDIMNSDSDVYISDKEYRKIKGCFNKFVIEDDILKKLVYEPPEQVRTVPYIPTSIQHKLVSDFHNSPYVNHPGADRLHKFLQKKVWFPKMSDVVKQVTSTCETCAKRKPNTNPFKPKMRLYKAPKKPFEVIHLDHFGGIRSLYDPQKTPYGLIVVDRFSHYMEVYPCENLTADMLIYTLMAKHVPTHGLPRKVVSDNGPTFASEEFRKWCKINGIKCTKVSEYRPQSNGEAEETVKRVKESINLLIKDPKIPWYNYLPYVLISLRNLPNTATGKSPYEIVFNRDMRFPIDGKIPYSIYRTGEHSLDTEAALWETAWKAVNNVAAKYQQAYKIRHDKKAKPHNLQVGQTVLVKRENYSLKYSKLYQEKYDGPYTIISISDTTARLQDQRDPMKQKSVHVSRLKLFRPDPKNESKSPNQVSKNQKIGKPKPDEANTPVKPHSYNLRRRN